MLLDVDIDPLDDKALEEPEVDGTDEVVGS